MLIQIQLHFKRTLNYDYFKFLGLNAQGLFMYLGQSILLQCTHSVICNWLIQ